MRGGRLLVFSEPFEASNGTVIITVSRKGRGKRRERAVGIYTVSGETATWTPVVDTSLHTLIGVCAGLAAAVISTLAVLRKPPWPEMTERVMIALAEARTADRRR